MEEFHWHRILEFVSATPPFDDLPQQDLEQAVSSMEVAYFPRETVVIEQGGPASQFLYFIQSGSARVGLPGAGDDGKELLVDERGEGDTFGGLSLLQGGKAMFRVTAREDLICYLLPAGVFKQLCASHPPWSATTALPWPATFRRCAGKWPANCLLWPGWRALA